MFLLNKDLLLITIGFLICVVIAIIGYLLFKDEHLFLKEERRHKNEK